MKSMYSLIGLMLMMMAMQLNASAFTPLSSDASQIQVFTGDTVNAGKDLIYIRPPNSSGISVNRFDHFDVTNRPLDLLNVPAQTSEIGGAQAAKLIVIIASNITLQNAINVVGPASDLLLLSRASGTVNCSGCIFNNLNRLTLAVATPSNALTESVSKVGRLNAIPNGHIIINGLSAPGALNIDLLADNISLNNTLTTHVRANKQFTGGYVKDINGQYSIGSGSVDMMLGLIDWDYESQTIQKSHPQVSAARQLNGTIYSVGVKISSAQPLVVNTHVNTRVDRLSSIRYQGKTYIADESITLQVLGDGSLSLNSQLLSDSDISLKSGGRLSLAATANVEGESVNLMAATQLENKASIIADDIGVAGQNVANEGRIEAFVKAEFYADKNIMNQFGGQILGNTITLQARDGFVRNGSRYPYRPNVGEGTELLNLTGAYLDAKLQGRIPLINCPICGGGVPAKQDIKSLAFSELGTFFKAGINVDTNKMHHQQPVDLSAHIVATALTIQAKAVENINPYWKRTPYFKYGTPRSVSLAREFINQVSIKAEKKLNLKAVYYVLNASALMNVESSLGQMTINTGLLANERYLILNKLARSIEKTDFIGSNSVDIYNEGFASTVAMYSPPGAIVSMGGLNVFSSDGVLNNLSYFEIFKDALFKTPKVKDVGIVNDEVKKYHEEWRTNPDDPLYTLYSSLNVDSKKYNVDVSKIDSLFFVQGALKIEGDWVPSNYHPFDDFKRMAVDSAIKSQIDASVSLPSGASIQVYDPNDVMPTCYIGICAYLNILRYSYSFYGDRVVINWDDMKYFNKNKTISVYKAGSKEVSLFDEIKKIFNEIWKKVSDLIASLSWWD